eukprot:scaffold14472_cov115-Isochrysis_galbana.AAC.5
MQRHSSASPKLHSAPVVALTMVGASLWFGTATCRSKHTPLSYAPIAGKNSARWSEFSKQIPRFAASAASLPPPSATKALNKRFARSRHAGGQFRQKGTCVT